MGSLGLRVLIRGVGGSSVFDMAASRRRESAPAGGQGTRLGSPLPKGLLDLQLPSGLTIFELMAQRFAGAAAKCGPKAIYFIVYSTFYFLIYHIFKILINFE